MITPAPATGTRSVPFIRETPLIGSIRTFTSDQLSFFRRLAATGDVCGFHMGPITMILFNKAEYIQSILVDHTYDYFDKSRISRRFTTREALFFSRGDTHRQRRKILAPMFQPRHIANYADTIVEYGKSITQAWSDNGSIDLNKQMAELTKRIAVKVIYDLDAPTEVERLFRAFLTGYEHTGRRTRSFMLPDSWPTAYNRHIRDTRTSLDQYIQSMIDERRRSHPTSPRIDILSVLAETIDEEGNPVSDSRIIDECVALLGAGYETTMTALSWTWYFLCQHPEIYQRVQQEVQQVLQGRSATLDDLPQLPLCLQVFKEAMRIYPPVPFILREARQDLAIDGYFVPKGASLLLSPYIMHRKPEYFPDPEAFDPDRFSPEREKQLNRYAYFPFGAGPQICIGNHLVLMMGHLLVATLAQQVTFKLIPDQHVAPDPSKNLTLCPSGKLEAVVQKN